MCIPGGNGFVAFVCVICSVVAHRSDCLVGQDLTQQLDQHWRIADSADRDLHGAHFQRFFINTDV